MDVVNIIREACVAEPEIKTFLHGRRDFANLTDTDLFNVAILDEPLQADGNLLQSGYMIPTYHLKIFIGGKSELDWTTDQHQVVIQPMYQIVLSLINRLAADARVDTVNRNIRFIEFMNFLDLNMSGLWFEFDLAVIFDLSNCINVPITP